MYHYITLGSAKIYMTGMGIIVFLVTFLLSVTTLCKKYRIQNKDFLKFFAFYLIGTYLLGSYMYYLIEEQVIIATNIHQLLLYLSPYGYKFHFIGIALGFIFSGMHFLRTKTNYEEKQIWIHILLISIMIASIPLGFFLLLGDNFIGKETQGSFYISAMKTDSRMAAYGKVIPLGFFLSFGFLILLLLYTSLSKRHKNISYLRLSFISIFLMIIFFYQQYPRHGVIDVLGLTRDIKQYFLLFLSCVFFYQHYKQKSYISQTINTIKQENIDQNAP